MDKNKFDVLKNINTDAYDKFDKAQQYYDDNAIYCPQMRSVLELVLMTIFSAEKLTYNVTLKNMIDLFFDLCAKNYPYVADDDVIKEMHIIRAIGNNYVHNNINEQRDQDNLTVKIAFTKICESLNKVNDIQIFMMQAHKFASDKKSTHLYSSIDDLNIDDYESIEFYMLDLELVEAGMDIEARKRILAMRREQIKLAKEKEEIRQRLNQRIIDDMNYQKDLRNQLRKAKRQANQRTANNKEPQEENPKTPAGQPWLKILFGAVVGGVVGYFVKGSKK